MGRNDEDDIDAFLASLADTSGVRRDSSSETDSQPGTRVLVDDALEAVRRAAGAEKPEASAGPAATGSSDEGFEEPQFGLEDPSAQSETRALVADALAAVRRAAGVEKPEASVGPALSGSPGSPFEDPELATADALPSVESAETSWPTPSEEQVADVNTTVFSTEERFAPSGEDPRGDRSATPTAIVEREGTAGRGASSTDRGTRPMLPMLVLVVAAVCGVLVAISAAVLLRTPPVDSADAPAADVASPVGSADAPAADVASPVGSADAPAADVAKPVGSADEAAPDIVGLSDSADAPAADVAKPVGSADVAKPVGSADVAKPVGSADAAAADVASPNDSAADGAVPDIAALELMVREGNYEKAVFRGLDLLKVDPRRAGVYRVLGIAYSRLGYKTEACESYRRYLQLAPRAPDRGNVEDIVALCE